MMRGFAVCFHVFFCGTTMCGAFLGHHPATRHVPSRVHGPWHGACSEGREGITGIVVDPPSIDKARDPKLGKYHNHNDSSPTSKHKNRRAFLSSVAASAASVTKTAGAYDEGPYQPAKRATAYLVDSTIPPTLIPFAGTQRESAILTKLGRGGGTSKAPYIDEEIDLNNMLQKAVFGTVDLIGDVVAPRPKPPTCVCLGLSETTTSTRWNENSVDVDGNVDVDVNLAVRLCTELWKPRPSPRVTTTALGFAGLPGSCQSALDRYAADGDVEALVAATVDGTSTLLNLYLPLLAVGRSKGVRLLALGPEWSDLRAVRKGGLQSLSPQQRDRYVADPEGFVEWTRDPRSRLYVDRSLLRRPRDDWVEATEQTFTPEEGNKEVINSNNNNNNNEEANTFAVRILEDEAVASAVARWTVEATKQGGGAGSLAPLAVVVSDVSRLRYLGGANGRLPRVVKHLDPESTFDDDCVTTILLNPTAKNTLSQSRFLRLEIGTAPENREYQTKVSDYLWFSTMPKVNMLPRLMRAPGEGNR